MVASPVISSTTPEFKSDDLRYLAAIAATGRVTAAAQRLGVDHSTVSRRVRALERVAGVRLLDRSPDGWVLTRAGSAIIDHAETIELATRAAFHAARGCTQAEALVGTVRIAAADAFGTMFVVPAINRVQQKHPGLSVELVTGASAIALRNNSFDIAIRPGRPPSIGMELERLCEYDNGFFASNGYLQDHATPRELRDLDDHRLIFFVESLQRIKEISLLDFVKQPNVVFSSTNIYALVEAIRLGAGVGLISKFVSTIAPDLVRVGVDIPPARTPVWLIARAEGLRRPEIQLIRESLHHEVTARRDELVWLG